MITKNPYDLSSTDAPDWFSSRELDWVPDHFQTFEVSEKSFAEQKTWIYSNTTGRFAFAKKYFPNISNCPVVICKTILGFENPNDAILYSLNFI